MLRILSPRRGARASISAREAGAAFALRALSQLRLSLPTFTIG